MDTKTFKDLFNAVAKAHGFSSAYGGWCRQFPKCIFVLALQKSNFGAYYELNLKLFVDGLSNAKNVISKPLFKNASGDIFRRQTNESREAFDLETSLSADERRAKLDVMFLQLVRPIADACGVPATLIELRDRGLLFLLPGVDEKLKGV